MFVVDGVVGDFLCARYGILRETPLTIHISRNRITSVECANKDLEKAFWAYTHTDENSDRVGEFAIGTNIGVERVIGNILQDEKFPGIHIAFGDPYGNHTGAAWKSTTHIDVVGLEFSIWLGGADGEEQIMQNGKFLVHGITGCDRREIQCRDAEVSRGKAGTCLKGIVGISNARFTAAKYAEVLRLLDERTRTKIEFRVAETPCFFAPELMERMVSAGTELTTQLLGNAGYMKESDGAIPAEYCVPNQDRHPHFMTVDFGLVRDGNGELQPKLVEMQAFPSIFGYQPVLAETYKEVYELDPSLNAYLGGNDETSYWTHMREVIVGDHDPKNVVLMEVDPEHQKTLPDFRMHEEHLGIRTVDVTKVVKQGKKLFYRDEANGQLVPIERIYSRVIVDELQRKGIVLPFDYRDELDVEWAGHPNWYFRVSKFSIPHLDHPMVPGAVFLDDWYAGIGREKLPEDRRQWVFKPLYSFAGKGIQFAPSDEDLAAIPVAERHDYLLQERVRFEPVIATPEGMTQAEIRILYAWPDGKAMIPMTSLVRMGRGLMMGVDHNRGQDLGGRISRTVSHGGVT